MRMLARLDSKPLRLRPATPDDLDALLAALKDQDFAEIAITSSIEVNGGDGPADAFRLEEVAGVAVVPALAQGKRCARSWKILPTVGEDVDYPDVSPRDALALREWKAMGVEV